MKKLFSSVIIAICIVFAVLPIILVLSVIVSTVISKEILDCRLGDMPNETNTIPAYVDHGTLYVENDKLSVSRLCEEQHEDASLQEILCIFNEEAYFVYTHQTAYTWVIASINLETDEFQDHCRFENTATYYRRNVYGEYSERNGYFRDGQIVLNDGETVLTYDVATGETVTCPYSDYPFPQRTIFAEFGTDKTMNLHIDGEIYTFTLEDMAAGSEGLAKIIALKEKKIWNDMSYLAGSMFRDAVCTVGDRIYCVDSVLDYLGSPHMVILEYNRQQGVWQYVTKKFCGADTYGNCYVIPAV